MTTFSLEALVKALHRAENEEDDVTFMECMDELHKRGLDQSQEFRDAYAAEWHRSHPQHTKTTARIVARAAHLGPMRKQP